MDIMAARGGGGGARAVAATIRLLIGAGEAKPAPPVGPALGQAGLNIMSFCKDFNAATAGIKVRRGRESVERRRGRGGRARGRARGRIPAGGGGGVLKPGPPHSARTSVVSPHSPRFRTAPPSPS